MGRYVACAARVAVLEPGSADVNILLIHGMCNAGVRGGREGGAGVGGEEVLLDQVGVEDAGDAGADGDNAEGAGRGVLWGLVEWLKGREVVEAEKLGVRQRRRTGGCGEVGSKGRGEGTKRQLKELHWDSIIAVQRLESLFDEQIVLTP